MYHHSKRIFFLTIFLSEILVKLVNRRRKFPKYASIINNQSPTEIYFLFNLFLQK